MLRREIELFPDHAEAHLELRPGRRPSDVERTRARLQEIDAAQGPSRP